MSEYCTCKNAGSYTLVFDDEGFGCRCGECGKEQETQYNIVGDLQESKGISFPNILDRFRWMVCTLPVVQKVVF